MTLALKAGYFVCESVSILHQIENNSSIIDLDDFDNENEEKTGFDEKEKINQATEETYLFSRSFIKECYSLNIENYKIQFLEFSTPPPELS